MNADSGQTVALLGQARDGNPEALGQLLEDRRNHLRRLAERQLRGPVRVRADASDVVQQAFLEAHRSFEQFRGEGEPEWLGWLERILRRAVSRIIRDHTSLQKRDARRERPLDGGGSEAGVAQHPGAASSPSQRLIRGEERERLELALAGLPEDQREAVRLRHLLGEPLLDIARKMGRSPAATAGLIKRGMQALRQHLNP
jgi:RNA polymerase sigma-70 factor (ECF subfamily)